MWTCILKPGHEGPCQPAPRPRSPPDRIALAFVALAVALFGGLLGAAVASIITTLQ